MTRPPRSIVDVAIDALGLGTQVELANLCGISNKAVSAMHGADRIPSRTLMVILRRLVEDELPDGSKRPIPRELWYADLPASERPK